MKIKMDREKNNFSNRRSGCDKGLHRSRSVRASFRLLGTRWKPPDKNSEQQQIIGAVKKETKDFLIEHLKSENIKKVKKINSKENLEDLTKIPMNVAPKAAALLQIPIVADYSNNNKSDFSGNKKVFEIKTRILNRSISLKESNKEPKTATIRRGSVWANSTSSKIFFCVLLIGKVRFYCILSSSFN